MNSNAATKNCSLSLLEDVHPSMRDVIPLRNAFSAIKRPRETRRFGRLSFKLIPLTTQEILEAENEPMPQLPPVEDESSDSDENELDKSVKSEKNLSGSNNDHGLGVSRLETPAKTNPNAKYRSNLAAATPIINCHKLSALEINEFATPASVRTVDVKPRIQCSIDVGLFLKTPVNTAVRNRPSVSNSVKNVGSDVMKDQINTNNDFKVKSSIRNVNSVKRDKNVDGVMNQNKVQFSLPSSGLSDGIFSEITVKNVSYLVLNQLGVGGSSVVYFCYDIRTRSERAIKKINLASDIVADGYIDEVKILERLQKCDRIVRMYDYEINHCEKLLFVVMERGGMDLSKILKDLSNTSKRLPLYMLYFYWMEMLYAVKQIHENGIIHSDLKPANFLKAEAGLKLIDFGIASCIQGDATSVVKINPVGSFNYISPEALTNEPSNNCNSPSFGKPKYKVNYKSDVWSLGCILYQLVYRKTPFQHIGQAWAKLSAILDPDYKIDYPEVDWIPPKILNTIKKCLQHDVKARPSVDQLIEEYENIYT